MQLAIPLAGAWLGSFFGPMGAQVGWLLGSALSPQNKSTAQGAAGDMQVQTGQYNVPIPYIMGKMRVAGNIIWAIDKTSYDIESGAKGSPVIGQGYIFNVAIAICEGPILGISKVWADNELIIDSSTTAKPLIGTLYTGSDVQMPDPTMETHIGSGLVPAYRGIAYFVLNNFNNGANPNLPNFTFEVVREV